MSVKAHCKKVLESLRFPHMYARQESVADAHKDTFRWIFDATEETTRPWHNFREWLENESGIYWIQGQAGCGKSTLMRFICEESATRDALGEWANAAELIMPAFFLWKGPDADVLQKRTVGMLRALLYQLLEQVQFLIPEVMPRDLVFAWTEKLLRDAMTTVLDRVASTHKVCLFIDGLDEFEGDPNTLSDLLIQWGQGKHVKICLSSRPWKIFEDTFAGMPQLRMQDLTHKDIKTYVADRLKEPNTVGDQTTSWQARHERQKLISNIVDRADGVFLWVKFALATVLQGLRNDDSHDELQHRLREMPKELDMLYRHMLTAIPLVYKDQAARYFRLMLHTLSMRISRQSILCP